MDEDSLAEVQRAGRAAQKLETNSDGNVPVELQLGDEKDFPHRGYIESFDNQLDPNTGSILLRAIFPNPDGRIVPGLFARIRVPLSEKHPALLVPERAIGTDQAQKYVLTLTPTNTVAYQPVELGPVVDGMRDRSRRTEGGRTDRGQRPATGPAGHAGKADKRHRMQAPRMPSAESEAIAIERSDTADRYGHRRTIRAPCESCTHRRSMNFSHFFIRRPIFAGVISALIFLVGLLAMWRLPISEYPEVVPPTVVVRAVYPGANPENDCRDGRLAAGTGHQRRRGLALHVLPGDGRRRHDA